MKNRKTNAAIVIAMVLIIIGGVMGVGGMSALGWDWNKLDTRVFEEKFYEQAETDVIKGIDIDLANLSLKIIKGDKVSLNYYDTKDNKMNIELNPTSGTLVISNNYKWNFSFKFFNFVDKEVVLTVPDNINLTIDVVNLNMNADTLKCENLDIEATNMNLAIGSLSAKILDINSTNAKLNINDLVADVLKVEATNIEIITPRLVSSDIYLDFTNFSRSTDISIAGNKADYKIRVDLTNGHPLSNQEGNGSGKKLTLDGTNFGGKISFI